MELHLLQNAPLFYGIKPSEIPAVLSCLQPAERSFTKGERLLRAGTPTTEFGLVLSGRVCIESCDVWGNRSLLGTAEAGDVFAESYACIPGQPMLVDVTAEQDGFCLFISAQKLFSPCEKDCEGHEQLLRNLMIISARKNLSLSMRIFHTSSKTIRGRVLSYLSDQVSLQHSRRIILPMNRQQLADYLSVDRSALSKELSRMKQDGLLDYHKNIFELSAAGIL